MFNLIPPINAVYILISLVFILVLLGFLVIFIYEMITLIFNIRANALTIAFRDFLQHDETVINAFFKELSSRNPARSASGKKQQLPTYLSGQTFASLMLSVFREQIRLQDASSAHFSHNPALQSQLSKMFEDASGQRAAFGALLERWYDEMIEQVSDAYRTRVNYHIFILSIVMAIFFNAGLGTLFHRLNDSFEKPQVESLNSVTGNLQKMLLIDSTLAHNESVSRLKNSVLTYMDYTLDYRPKPLLGYTKEELNQTGFLFWLFWVLGVLMSAFIMTFVSFFGLNYIKKALGDRTLVQNSAPSEQSSPAESPTPPQR